MEELQIVRFDIRNKEYFEEAKRIRKKVFVEEFYIDHFLEYDGLDRQSTLYLVLKNGNPVGTARWRTTYDGIKLERFAVLKEHRNKNIGQFLLDKILRDVQHLDMDIYLNASINAVKFFEQKGFIVEGEKFTELEVEHYKMILN
ncbi:MAG: GNAT family N-acetyltransferase [Chlorobi bacterium]|nr:GNAT family N-acetyltransferase [Chlorobiota bacterium]